MNTLIQPDDDGKGHRHDLIVNDGGDMTFIIHEGDKAEDLFLKDGTILNPIIKNQVRSMTLTIILRLYQGIQDTVPVLLETLTLSGKHISRFIMRNDSHIVVLGRENVAREPTEVTSYGLESLRLHPHHQQ